MLLRGGAIVVGTEGLILASWLVKQSTNGLVSAQLDRGVGWVEQNTRRASDATYRLGSCSNSAESFPSPFDSSSGEVSCRELVYIENPSPVFNMSPCYEITCASVGCGLGFQRSTLIVGMWLVKCDINLWLRGMKEWG